MFVRREIQKKTKINQMLPHLPLNQQGVVLSPWQDNTDRLRLWLGDWSSCEGIWRNRLPRSRMSHPEVAWRRWTPLKWWCVWGECDHRDQGMRGSTPCDTWLSPWWVWTILLGSWIGVISAKTHICQFLGHGHIYLESAHIQSCSYCHMEQIISLDQCKMSFGSGNKIKMHIA